jgi:hypothetical protein
VKEGPYLETCDPFFMRYSIGMVSASPLILIVKLYFSGMLKWMGCDNKYYKLT